MFFKPTILLKKESNTGVYSCTVILNIKNKIGVSSKWLVQINQEHGGWKENQVNNKKF